MLEKQPASPLFHTDECPDIELLGEALEEDCSPQLRLHTDSCPICQAELASMRSFLEALPTEEEETAIENVLSELQSRESAMSQPVKSSPQSGRFKEWGARLGELFRLPTSRMAWSGAIGLLLVTAVSLSILTRNTPPSLSGLGDPILRGGEIQLLAPRGNLSASAGEFLWDSVSGASSYRVSLFGVDESVLVTASTPINQFQPNTAFLNELLPGRTLLWQVEAFDQQGRKLAESARIRIRIGVKP